VLRPGGRVVLLTLDAHDQRELTAPYGERHPGFTPRALKGLLDEVASLRARVNELEAREERAYAEVEINPLPLAGEGGARKRAG